MPLHFSHIARYAPSIQSHIHLKPFAQSLTIVMKHPLSNFARFIRDFVTYIRSGRVTFAIILDTMNMD